MRPEYVRFNAQEKVFGQKHLLHTQLETISTLKHHEAYKLLRMEELLLKIQLKTKLEEAKEAFALFSRLLPKPAISEHEVLKRQHAATHAAHPQKKSLSTLESELEEIKRKLAALQ